MRIVDNPIGYILDRLEEAKSMDDVSALIYEIQNIATIDNCEKLVDLTRKQKKQILLRQDPRTFEEYVLQFFLRGGRISSDDFARFTGYKISYKDAKQFIWAYSKKGCKLDLFLQDEDHPERFGMQDRVGVEMENEIIEILLSNPTPAAIYERLVELNNKDDVQVF